jgi:hypothetical protein
VAIANPNVEIAQVEFYFTDRNGQEFGRATTTVKPNAQLAAFLDESPFNGGVNLDGTFTFSSSVPVAATAIQGRINGRGEFLMTTLPVARLDTPTTMAPVVFPHWAEGQGWETDFVLVNTSGQSVDGIISFSEVEGIVRLPLNYQIPPRGSQRLRVGDSGGPTRVGFARLSPVTGPTPSGIAVFRLNSPEGLITEAGVQAVPEVFGSLGYAEVSAAVRTALALANPSSVPASVTVDLTDRNGTPLAQTTLLMPPLGHYAGFLDEIPGLSGIPVPFQGTIRVRCQPGIGISVTGLRVRKNERGEFLISASPHELLGFPSPLGAGGVFPHFAVGDGFDMQFVLFGFLAGSGSVSFFGVDGQPAALPVP